MQHRFKCIDAHTCGNPVRVVTSGHPELRGETMSEKRADFLARFDWIRTALMFEPRGHDMMSGAFIYPPLSPDADAAILFIETSGCLPMCGHGTIGTVTVAVEQALLKPATEGRLVLEVPAGRIEVTYQREGNRVVSVKIFNIASFLAHRDIEINCPELGQIKLDVAYGGNFYAIIEPQDNYPGLDRFSPDQILRLSPAVRELVDQAVDSVHPEDSSIRGCSHVLWTGPPRDPGADAANAVFYGARAIDRSPCGTGTSARMAQLYALGKLPVGRPFVHESIIGSQFVGRVEDETRINDQPAILPSIEGWARITGFNEIIVDEDDPFAHGFTLGPANMTEQTEKNTPIFAATSLIAGQAAEHGSDTFQAVDPSTQAMLEPAFAEADQGTVARAAEAAREAFQVFRQSSPASRARLLRAIADRIADLGDPLFERAQRETGLPLARFKGESLRTQGQLKMFAGFLESADAQPIQLEPAEPERSPLPKPAIRQQKIPLGPVAVFGASNFPLAFSTAGGDTASALAAGCCVVIKGHPAHPGTSELVAGAIYQALHDCDLPAGVFSLIQSSRNGIAAELVRHPAIKAVGFTGSLRGGRALMEVAATRPDPIPVFAEMGSINPVFLMPAALAERGDELARGFAQSLTLGEGQFCTNPGLVVGIAGEALERFIETSEQSLRQHQPGPMLTAQIHQAFVNGAQALAGTADVAAIGEPGPSAPGSAKGRIFQTSAQVFMNQPDLQDEVFGPASLVVACADAQEMQAVAENLAGQLTATLQVSTADREPALALLPILEQRAGRIVFNGYPTGVEVCHGMVHGGPWPASSDSNSTSVGIGAMQRFQRPICYQDLPSGWMD